MQRTPSHVSGRHDRTTLFHATSTGRRCIAAALKTSDARPSELRTFLYASVKLVSWSRTGDRMPLPEVSSATHLHPHTVGRSMRAWHDRGIWNYSPARRAGEYGTVHLNDIDNTELGFSPTDSRDPMAVVWPTMRRAALRTCTGPVAAVRVVLAVLGGAACWSRLEVEVSHKELAETAGCTVAQVRRALTWLVDNDIIEYTPGTGHRPSRIRLVPADAVNVGPGRHGILEAHSSTANPAPADTTEAPSPRPLDAHPGCASGSRPIHNRDNAELVIPLSSRDATTNLPGDDVPQSTTDESSLAKHRTSDVVAQLAVRSGRDVPLHGPGGERLHTEITLRPTWSVGELVEALLAVKLPASVLHPAALFAHRAAHLPTTSPKETAAHHAAADAERRQIRHIEETEAAAAETAADEAANAALEPYLERVDQLSPADLAACAAALPSWLRTRFTPVRITHVVRHGLAEVLAARDGVDLVHVADTARRNALTHRSGTMGAV